MNKVVNFNQYDDHIKYYQLLDISKKTLNGNVLLCQRCCIDSNTGGGADESSFIRNRGFSLFKRGVLQAVGADQGVESSTKVTPTSTRRGILRTRHDQSTCTVLDPKV